MGRDPTAGTALRTASSAPGDSIRGPAFVPLHPVSTNRMPEGLRSAQQRLLVRATEAFIDTEQGALPSAATCGVGARLAKMATRLPADQRLLLRVGCLAVDAVALLRFGRPFWRLDDTRARRLLRGFARSWLKPLRRLHFVLKMMTQFAYFSAEESWATVGYDGPWLGRVAVETLAPPQLDAEPGP